MIDGKYLKDIIKDTKYFLLSNIDLQSPGFKLLVYFNSKIILGILSFITDFKFHYFSGNHDKNKKPKNK